MRRALASLLSAVLSFPLIAPSILAQTDSGLPACCRRNGQHHCAMPSMRTGDATPDTSPSIRADLAKCPYGPAGTSAPGESKVAPPRDSQAIFALLFSHPAVPTQTEAQYRVSFSRSRHKRGPPAFLS
jgi:hypothetical protein